MKQANRNTVPAQRTLVVMLLAFVLALTGSAVAKDKKKKAAEPVQPTAPLIDTSKLVWPAPPDVARIRFVTEIKGEARPPDDSAPKKKRSGWMDRLAGIEQADATQIKPVHTLAKPYGVGVDSKGRIYAADSYVAAIFIFNPDGSVEFIRNGKDARFKDLIGLALDDGDRLFVADAGLHQISVFDANHKLEIVFGAADLGRPSGIALDRENRFLYVVDTLKDNVAVFDADKYKLLRTIGGPAKVEADDSPGIFTKPTNVAVDGDGNVYVTDTLNNRVQIYDADGKFVSMFGKAGDGPGYFARPKGIAIDSDGHIWVADASQGRVQVFDKAGHLLAFFGEPGTYPGQFGLPTGLCIDNQNRVVVSEQLKGRLQVFRYVPDGQAGTNKKAENVPPAPPVDGARQ